MKKLLLLCITGFLLLGIAGCTKPANKSEGQGVGTDPDNVVFLQKDANVDLKELMKDPIANGKIVETGSSEKMKAEFPEADLFGMEYVTYEYVADDNWSIEYSEEILNKVESVQITVSHSKSFYLPYSSISIFQSGKQTEVSMYLETTEENANGVNVSMNRKDGLPETCTAYTEDYTDVECKGLENIKKEQEIMSTFLKMALDYLEIDLGIQFYLEADLTEKLAPTEQVWDKTNLFPTILEKASTLKDYHYSKSDSNESITFIEEGSNEGIYIAVDTRNPELPEIYIQRADAGSESNDRFTISYGGSSDTKQDVGTLGVVARGDNLSCRQSIGNEDLSFDCSYFANNEGRDATEAEMQSMKDLVLSFKVMLDDLGYSFDEHFKIDNITK